MVGKQPKRKPRAGIDEYGRTPLHYAALEGDAASVRRLLEQGVDASTPDDNGWTPLHFAAQEWHVEVARMLLDAGAEVDAVDAHGGTALWRAVFDSNGRGELIVLLRERGADPRKQNRHGGSPLALARTIGNFDVAQYFRDLT